MFTIKQELTRFIFVFRRFVLIVTMLVFCAFEADAQYDVSFSHYWSMETYYNPAAVGKGTKLNVSAAYAHSFAGFENNPKTAFVSGDMPFYAMNSYHGVGLHLLNDQIGLFTHKRLALQYALKRTLFGGTLSAGVQLGVLMEGFSGSELDLEDSSDPAFSTSDLSGNGLDVGFGLYYIHGKWYVGLSGQHLTAPKIELGETNELQVDRTYYFTGGYNIQLRNPFLSIQPSVLLRTDGVAFRGDVTARLVYTNDEKVMFAGVGYSPTNSITVHIGGSVHGILLGYSYEIYTSAINPGNGSHELYIGYQHDINLVKKGRNKHQSVRTL